MDLTPYTGPQAFGRAYQTMLEHDTHAEGSVDRVLLARMVRLCAATAAYLYGSFTPLGVRCREGARPELGMVVRWLACEDAGSEAVLAYLVAFTRDLGERAEQELDAMRVGGREEEIIRRGSDWCADVARVACALCQIAGFPARLIYLFDLDRAYSGHAIIEAYRAGAWGALDAVTGIIYTHSDGKPASVWDLMRDPELIKAHRSDPRAFYTTVEQFRAAGVANYFCWQADRYSYTVCGLNDYYRSILDMSDRGWPGGLRWLHGEAGADTPAGG